MYKCRHCLKEYEARKWQIVKRDFECDPCRKEYHAQYRLKRKQAGNPVVSGKMSKEYHQEYSAKYFSIDENRKRRNSNMRKYQKQHSTREHHEARWKVHRALQANKLIKLPCQICGDKNVDAHHDNYNDPLNVRWLCRTHHLEHHVKAKEST